MPFTQENREFGLSTDLGEDALLIKSMVGHEELGRLPEFHLEMLSEDPDIDLEALLRKVAKLRINPTEDGEPRQINGIFTRVAMTGAAGRMYTYSATIHPWLWLLTKTSNCRIFQNKSAKEIITAVLQEYNENDFSATGLSANYESREFCVQYRESDFDFVARLMEEEGIYYFFTYENGKQTMNLADSYSAHSAIDGESTLNYLQADAGQNRNDTGMYGWAIANQIHSDSSALDDYDFIKPNTDLAVSAATSKTHGGLKRYDYPGRYATTGLGNAYARHRAEAFEAQFATATSTTRCRRIFAGGLFTLSGHPRNDQNQEHLVVAASYRLDNGSFAVGAGGSADYVVQLTAMPSSTPFRLAANTPRPVVKGPQTAVVVGKSGEEIWIDKYGRIKLQFHWDQDGQRDENSSCWVRVAHNWAGKNWGAVFHPRIGHEVVVEFLEGDPDRPLVTGSVYNDSNMPPYQLPDNQTQSTIKSRSSKSGTTANFNEIRFEDKKDSEEVYIHAERDMNRVVENNDSIKVGHDKKDAGDQTIDIFHDQTVTIGNDQKSDIKHDQSTKIGNTCVFEAQTSIELKVGSSSIKIEPAKITIKTTQLEINASATAKFEAGATMDIKAGGPMTIQGAVVKIN